VARTDAGPLIAIIDADADADADAAHAWCLDALDALTILLVTTQGVAFWLVWGGVPGIRSVRRVTFGDGS
jgi:hypothetical protein